MKSIKIFLQSPWKATDSPYYKYLRTQTLKNIEYINAQDFKLIQNKKILKLNNWLKKSIKKLIRKFYPAMPNAHHTFDMEKYDLIHCAHCISKNNSPWVCDIEFVGQFWVSGLSENFPCRERVLRYLKSSYCKRILAWTEWSKKGILKEFPEIREKVEVLYPGLPKQKIKKFFSKKINLLFIGRDFELKGGAIALEIFDKLTKKYTNVWATIVSDVPKEILNKYKNIKIEFYSLTSHEQLFKDIYPNADIFVYPTFSDTFGFAILEAQSFGLPVIAMKTKSTHTLQETISEGKTGFIVENLTASSSNKTISQEIIKQITGRIEELIINKKKLRNMSKNCQKEIKTGKFSIKERNKKLKMIYREAIA